jgi:NAD(P)-dependent dehydrogenase (short-subunit alcohol dehydrogenase family)
VLATEVAPFGIRVAVIEPGVVATAIVDKAMAQPIDMESPYFPYTFRTSRFLIASFAAPSTADEVAEVIWGAVTTDDPTLRYPVGADGIALAERRPGVSDDDWVAGLSDADDAVFRARMLDWSGVEVPPL